MHEALARLRPGSPVVTHLHGTELKMLGRIERLDAVAATLGTSLDAKEGMCKNRWFTRSVAKYASDPDGAIASYTLVQTSFSKTGFNFTWNATNNGN